MFSMLSIISYYFSAYNYLAFCYTASETFHKFPRSQDFMGVQGNEEVGQKIIKLLMQR